MANFTKKVMEEIVFALNLPVLFLLAITIFILNILILKKYIFTWFDPLAIYIFFNSCSTSFVIFLYFWEKQIKEFYIITYFLSTVGLLIGIIISSKRGLKKIDKLENSDTLSINNYERVFDCFLVICTLVTITSNIVMLISTGTLPILSDNPSVSKVELYTGGWGLIRRIDLVSVNFIFSIAFINIFHPINKISIRKNIFCWFCIIIGILVLFTMGSKSSLINILNSLFGIFMVNLFINNKSTVKPKATKNLNSIKAFSKYAFTIAIFYMLIVIIKSGVESNVSNSFITRLVGSGDTFYFFYTFDVYEKFNLGPVDFIFHVINPILGFLRILPYEYPIGAYILLYSYNLPLSSFGPNAQHHIEGLLYFGKVGAFFYSLVLGYIIGYFRTQLLNNTIKAPNFLLIFIYISFVSIVVDIATELGFFLLLFYDIVIFGSIFYIISLFIKNYLFQSK